MKNNSYLIASPRTTARAGTYEPYTQDEINIVVAQLDGRLQDVSWLNGRIIAFVVEHKQPMPGKVTAATILESHNRRVAAATSGPQPEESKA